MAKWQAAYWEEGGLELYEFGTGNAERLFSGPVDALKPTGGQLKRRVLVIGRNNFVRLRRRYPPAKMNQLSRVVALEAPDLFPISKPELHCRIFETYASHILLDVWAWEKEPADRLRAVFPFQYAIPEDLSFLSGPPAVHVYQAGSMIHAVACGGGRFFDAASFQTYEFSSSDLEKFHIGLPESASTIQEIRIYGDSLSELSGSTSVKCNKIPGSALPPPLDVLNRSGLNLRQFRTGEGVLSLPDTSMLFRFAIYAAAACGLSLYLTLTNYDSALRDSKMFSRDIDKEITLMEARHGKDGNDQEAIREFKKKSQSDLSPLHVFDALASELSKGSHVKSLSIHEGMVDAAILSRAPLEDIKRLEGSKYFRRLSLKGSPTSDSANGAYSFSLLLEMRQ